MYMHGYEKHGAKIVLFLTPQAARGLGSRWGGGINIKNIIQSLS